MDSVNQKIRQRGSLRRKLVLRIGVPLLATFLLMIVLQFRIDREVFIESMRQELRAEVQIACLKVESDLLAIEHTVAIQNELAHAASVKLNPSESEAQFEIFAGILESIVRSNEFVYGAAMAFDLGAAAMPAEGFAPYVCRAGTNGELRELNLAKQPGYDYLHKPWFTSVSRAGESVWSEPYFDQGAGDVFMTTFSLRFPKGRGLPAGVATADVALNRLSQRIQGEDESDPFEFALVSGEGRVVSSPNPSMLMKSASDFPPQALERQLIEGAIAFRNGGPEFLRVGSGSSISLQETRLVFVAVPSSGWTFVGSFPEAALVPSILQALLLGPGLLAIGAGISMVVVWRSARSAVAPLEGVVAAIGQLSQGDFKARAPAPRGDDEIATLAASFNAMGEALQSAIAQREASEAQRAAASAQLNAARGIQQLLLPESDGEGRDHNARSSTDERRTDALEGASIVGLCKPAGEIAGDYFDWFQRHDGTFALVIADVCGKGMPAAMMMAVGRTLLRRAAFEMAEPHLALAKVNEDLLAQAPNSNFTTAILLYIDGRNGIVRYANAGHPTGVVVGRNGSAASTITATGTVLGLIAGAQWETVQFSMAAGDSIVVFSDGVTEAGPTAETGEQLFGPERARESIAQAFSQVGGDPGQLVHALAEAVMKWSRGRQADDLTILAMLRK